MLKCGAGDPSLFYSLIRVKVAIMKSASSLFLSPLVLTGLLLGSFSAQAQFRWRPESRPTVPTPGRIQLIPDPNVSPPPMSTAGDKCEEALTTLAVPSVAAHAWCIGDWGLRNYAHSPTFSRCFKSVRDSGEPIQTAAGLCESEDYAKLSETWLRNPSIRECQQTLRTALVSDLSLSLCAKYKNEFNEHRNTLESCVKDGLEAAGAGFYRISLSDKMHSRPNLHRDAEDSAYYFLARDCLAGNTRRRSGGPISVIGQTVFNYQQQFSTTLANGKNSSSVAFGGVSGCSFVAATQKFYCISDKKEDALIYVMKAEKGPNQFWHFYYLDSIHLNEIASHKHEYSTNFYGETVRRKDITDFEDISVLADGSFLVSGELDDIPEAIRQDDLDPLYHFAADGSFLNKVPISPDFVPKVEKVKIERKSKIWVEDKTPEVKPALGRVFSDDAFPEAKGHYETQTEYTVEERQTKGIRANKGLEAMSVDPAKQNIFYTSEQGLVQNEKNDLLLVRQSMANPNDRQEFAYTLEDEVDNGLSALLALDTNHLLGLERSYDSAKQRLTVKLFKITLDAQPDRHGKVRANKEELVNLKSLLPSFAAGFKRLDNFEALSFGPAIDSDSISLVLATDDNFSAVQTTIFLMLRVPRSLLF